MLREIISGCPIVFTIIWQSTLLVAAGLVAGFLCKRHPARAHQMLFLSMMAALIVPFLTIAVENLELGMFVAEPKAVVENAATGEMSVQPYNNSRKDFEPSVPSLQRSDNPSRGSVPSVRGESEKTGLSWRNILLTAWAAVSATLLARLILTFILGFRLVKRAEAFSYPKIMESIKTAASKLGIKENVAVCGSRSVSSPVIWCWKQSPILLFPSGKSRLMEKIDMVGILCHELAHFKRRDHVAGLLSELMVVLLPWHPLLWWAKRRLLSLSEHACDDWVIAAGSCGMNYAESLLDFVPAKQMAFVPSVVQNQNVLKGRVMRILKERYGNPRLGKKWIFSAVLVTTCITLTVAFAQTRSAIPEEGSGTVLRKPATEGAAPTDTLPDLAAMAQQRLENPDMMNLERQMQKKMVLEKYGALFNRLGLPDETTEAFKALLVENAMLSTETSQIMTDQSLSEEEKNEKLKQLSEQKKAEFEKQARALLGPENYKVYEGYRARLWEHQFVTQYVNFSGAADDLSDDKEQDLIDALYDVRKEMETEYGLDSYDGSGFFVGVNFNSTEEERRRRLEIMDGYIESARGILSESQAGQFADIVKGMKETMTMAAKNLANGGTAMDISQFSAMEQQRVDNPDIMNMERMMQGKMVTQKYGALFEKLGLSDEKTEAFKTLMVEKEIQTMENRSAPMGQSQSVAEIEAKKQKLRDQETAEFEEQARDLLGDEGYEAFDAYRARLWEHQLVTQIVNLSGAEDGFLDDKEQELIDAMYKVRKEMETEYGLSSYDGQQLFIGVSLLETQEERGRRLEIYDRYIESGRDVLSESQAEQFETLIKGMQETMAMTAQSAAPSLPFPEGGGNTPQ